MKGPREHKWLILAFVILLTITHFTLVLTFGTLYLPMLDAYQQDRYTTTTVQSLFQGVSFSCSVICGILVSRFGVHRIAIAGSILAPLGFFVSFFATSILFLDLSIGVISAIGICCVHISNSTSLVQVFSGPRKQIAISLQFTAVSISLIVYPYLLRWLVNTYGLRGTFLILSGILLNSFPAAILFAYDESINPTVKTIKTTKIYSVTNAHIFDRLDKKEKQITFCIKIAGIYSNFKAFLNKLITKEYVCFVVAAASVIAFLTSYMLIIIDIFVTKGFSRDEGLTAFIPLSVFGFIARLLPGFVKLKKGFNSMILPIVFSFCGMVGQLLIYASSNYVILLVGSGLTGISVGGVMSASGSILMKLLETSNFAVGFGLFNTVIGILIPIIGPLSGSLRDSTGSYDILQLTTAGIHFVAMVLFILALIARRRKRTKKILISETNFIIKV